MSETIHPDTPAPHPAVAEAQAARVRPLVSRAALEGVGVAAQHFHGGDDHFIGKTSLGEHRLLVAQTQKDGGLHHEAVGSGHDVESALRDSLNVMRSLETVRTRSLVHIEMSGASSVDFTSFAHYNPKVAPGRDSYPVPSSLEAMLADDKAGQDTYTRTLETEGWQTELRGIVDNYVAHTPAGQKLAESLKIRSLDHLTPEQGVKLSAAVVQNLSKYSKNSAGEPSGDRADGMTTPELLREGIAKKDDPSWEGNGVCRNIASNVKAVFESLKQTQGELSMLNNTYAVYGGGSDGTGYADKRADNHHMALQREGHAWNTFVTIDAKGSAVATIIDATWALDQDADTALEHLDRTEVRAAAQIAGLFQRSERKTEAFGELTYYTDRLLRASGVNRQLTPKQQSDLREYAVTEYLRAAGQVEHLPEAYELPDSVMVAAYRLRAQLQNHEVENLFKLERAGGPVAADRMKALIRGYDQERDKAAMPQWQMAENLVFRDEELQELAYEAVGPERVAQLAELGARFRMRLRQQHPEKLPHFDPHARKADALELHTFASQEGIHDKDPDVIMRTMKRTIKRLAGDEADAKAIMAGRSDYDLAASFGEITRELRGK